MTTGRGGPHRSRRAILKGIGAAGGGLLLGGLVSACATAAAPPLRDARRFLSGDRYFVAHRGAGDEAPEHTMAAYTRIVDRGAAAVEISVHRTADGVLVCHHDADLARTCNGFAGVIARMTYAGIAAQRVDMRRYLGPAWEPQPIPRLDDVLDRIGGRAILFVEPKDPAASPDVLDAIVRRRLQSTTVHKQYYKNTGDGPARQAGLAVWNYYDRQTTAAEIPGIAARSDAIGAEANEPIPADRLPLVAAAVSTGVPVIAWALHRRSVLDELAAAGVRGFMCSSWSYLAGALPTRREDDFATGRVTPGDLPVDFTAAAAPTWTGDGAVALASPSGTQSLTMGSMSPIRSPSYTISLQMRFGALPPQSGQHAGIVVGRDDDQPYRFRTAGAGSGQLVVLRADGTLELREVPADNGKSLLVASSGGEPAVAGRWEALEVQVTPAEIIVLRTPDGGRRNAVRGPNTTKGNYFALTRNYSATDASVAYRKISVTPS